MVSLTHHLALQDQPFQKISFSLANAIVNIHSRYSNEIIYLRTVRCSCDSDRCDVILDDGFQMSDCGNCLYCFKTLSLNCFCETWYLGIYGRINSMCLGYGTGFSDSFCWSRSTRLTLLTTGQAFTKIDINIFSNRRLFL